jgi:hypothetical protein
MRRSSVAEIEITLPTVQYGNVKVRATAEELGLEGVQDAGALGVAAAVYLNLFTQGFKLGTQIDVDYTGPVSASEGEVGAQAQEWLDEGLGGVTEVPEDEYDSASEAKAATQERTAPWTEPAVDVKPKPWETSIRNTVPVRTRSGSVADAGKAAPTNAVKVAEIDW